MEKTKKENNIWNGRDMPLDKKSNEDFNEQHPEHDENGLINASAIGNDMDAGNDSKQTSAMKTTATKREIKEEAKTYTCSMHPGEISDRPGKCSKCGMALVEKK